MKKMHISFVLDETGSMEMHKTQTISGFNEYIQTLYKDKNKKNISFTLTKFNSEKVEVVHNGVGIKDVELLNENNYRPRMNTPLYDAIGRTINSVTSKKGDSVLIVIQTDGEENSSKEFTRESIFALITEKKDLGWTFVFLGADQDAWAAGSLMGIDKGNVLSYQGAQSRQAFNLVAQRTSNYSSKGGTQTDSFFEN